MKSLGRMLGTDFGAGGFKGLGFRARAHGSTPSKKHWGLHLTPLMLQTIILHRGPGSWLWRPPDPWEHLECTYGFRV